MKRNTISALGILAYLAIGLGCTKQPMTAESGALRSAQLTPSVGRPDAPAAAERPTPGEDASRVSIDKRIAQACALTTPRFDFDSTRLHPGAKQALAALIKCLQSGPLADRKLSLVGHADPRGELYYNYGLGQLRAGKVARYLGNQGLANSRMSTSSRGELDATGSDEAGWARDRRVDISLAGD